MIKVFVNRKINIFVKENLFMCQKSESYKLTSSDFLAAIAHELKTPISAIQSFVEVLNEDLNDKKVSREECLEYVAEIRQLAADMDELVHDILDVSSGVSSNFSVDLSQEIDIGQVVKKAVKLNRDYAIRRNIELRVEISPDVGLIFLDEKRMKQIMTNLISNAIKYSPNKTLVKVTLTKQENHLEIAVIDQGFGMTSIQVQDAFIKYKTIENPNSEIVDSFGLGLPIVKQLVELQKGTIEAESESEKGTKMILRFPY